MNKCMKTKNNAYANYLQIYIYLFYIQFFAWKIDVKYKTVNNTHVEVLISVVQEENSLRIITYYAHTFAKTGSCCKGGIIPCIWPWKLECKTVKGPIHDTTSNRNPQTDRGCGWPKHSATDLFNLSQLNRNFVLQISENFDRQKLANRGCGC